MLRLYKSAKLDHISSIVHLHGVYITSKIKKEYSIDLLKWFLNSKIYIIDNQPLQTTPAQSRQTINTKAST